MWVRSQSAGPERCFNQVGARFTCKQYTRLERLARAKQSSLLQIFVNYGQKKFYEIGPRYLDCLSLKALIFVQSWHPFNWQAPLFYPRACPIKLFTMVIKNTLWLKICLACSSDIVFQLQDIYKSYSKVLTPVNNSLLLLKLEILDKLRLVTFHAMATQRKCIIITGSY